MPLLMEKTVNIEVLSNTGCPEGKPPKIARFGADIPNEI